MSVSHILEYETKEQVSPEHKSVALTSFMYLTNGSLVGFSYSIDPNDGLEGHQVTGSARTNVIFRDRKTGRFLSYKRLAEECHSSFNYIAQLPAYPGAQGWV